MSSPAPAKAATAPTPPPSPQPLPLPLPLRRRDRSEHRGGAWKVAYADFVTALMALFIVLWMMSASDRVKQSVSGYFHDPRGFTHRLGAGPAGSGEGLKISRGNVAQFQDRVQEALRRAPDLRGLLGNIKLSVTGEGLRIDLLESDQGMFFITGSPHPTDRGERLLRLLAAELSHMPNGVVIEGHTDARPFRNALPSEGFGNWELSVERANAARRLLHAFGVRPDQIVEVRGFADRKLMNTKDPNDARNRRVSLVVQFLPEGT